MSDGWKCPICTKFFPFVPLEDVAPTLKEIFDHLADHIKAVQKE